MKRQQKATSFQAPKLALFLGLASCMASPGDGGGKPNDSQDPGATPQGDNDDVGDLTVAGEDPFGIDSFLGVAISGCASTGWNATTSTLTLTLSTAPVVLSAPTASGRITANGIGCSGTVGGVANTALTISNVAKIAVTGTSGADKVILDLLPGTFGTKLFSATGGIQLSLAAGADTFMVRGTGSVESWKFAKSTTTSDTYYELSGDKIADVKITNTGTLTSGAALGAGADVITGVPVAADIASFAGAAVVIGKVTNAMVVYGGDGADTITGGDGADVLHGGAGDDTFRMAAIADGGDTYAGDAGVDFVDYSGRTANLKIDTGGINPRITGTVDLSTLDFSKDGPIDGKTLSVSIDGDTAIDVVFADPVSPQDIVDQINDATDPAVVAALVGKNYLALMTETAEVDAGSIAITTGDANSSFGLTDSTTKTTIADADDGLSSELDDVQGTIENISAGTGNDTIFGNDAKSVLKGGAGDDIISGGNDATFTQASDADSLQGEAGDDTFYLSQANYYAVIAGGAGTDVVNFSGRTGDLTLTNDGTANDGTGSDKNNIGTDVEGLVGGFGNDTLTGATANDTLNGGGGNDILSGAAGDDTLVGGLGADKFNGGAGTDIADYSAETVNLTITLCVSADATGAPSDCGAANDGGPSETDQVANCEWVKGGTGNDTVTASTVSAVLEGGAGNDTLAGGAAADYLYGDAGNDTLSGAAADDTLEGNAGDDVLIGGSGDGDICISDAADTATAAAECEI